jgi:hypothetical protein
LSSSSSESSSSSSSSESSSSSFATFVDLDASINIVEYKELYGYLKSFQTASQNLSASINSMYLANLPAFIDVYKELGVEKNLSASLVGGYGPYDIQAFINAIPFKTLSAYIKGFKGIQIPYNLSAAVESYYAVDLGAIIGITLPVNLSAYLNAVGQAVNLSASIVPKVIYLKRSINVALLEHKDLKALINFMCFASEYRSLGAYLKAVYKLDLKGYIIGWYGNMADNVIDLKCYINTAIYDVEDVIDIRFVPSSSRYMYSILKLRFGSVDKYTVFDTLQIIYGSYYALDLSATICGTFTSFDLGASLTPIFDYNYSELPLWIKPKTHEIVINLARFEEQWQRTVELMFETYGDDPFHYFYVSGENKIYRIDRSRHWVVWAKSYQEVSDSMIERRNVRHKYLFRMSDYRNIDEAIRDLIDRVSSYRRTHLGAYINGILPPHLDLSAHITPDVVYRWQIHLGSSLRGLLRGYIGTETLDLGTSITGI